MADWRARRKALRGNESRIVELASRWSTSIEPIDRHNGNESRKLFLDACLSHLKKSTALSNEERSMWETVGDVDFLRLKARHTFDLLGSELTADEWAKLLVVPLEQAAATRDKGLATQLVKAGAAIGSAVHAAVKGRCEEILDFLLENGGSTSDLDYQGDTPLHGAARRGLLEITRSLLLKGADTNAVSGVGGTPVYWAARHGHAAVVETLLAAGADLTIRFEEGELSPLDAAAGFGRTDTMRLLVEHGTDVNAAGAGGRTSLYWCVYAGKAKAVDLLAEAGANLEARTSGGDFVGLAPLHLAIFWRKFDAAVALLKHGADVNVKSVDEGGTPLHYAAAGAGMQGMARVVDLLLRMGADETIVTNQGRTPMDIVAPTGAVAYHGQQQGSYAYNLERVRLLLANAPADRAWRRRGFLVMCRAHADRMQPQRLSGQPRGGTAWGGCSCTRKATADGGASGSVGGSAADEGITGEWASVAASVVELQEDGLFRKIVGHL